MVIRKQSRVNVIIRIWKLERRATVQMTQFCLAFISKSFLNSNYFPWRVTGRLQPIPVCTEWKTRTYPRGVASLFQGLALHNQYSEHGQVGLPVSVRSMYLDCGRTGNACKDSFISPNESDSMNMLIGKLLPSNTSSRRGVTFAFIWSHVFGHQRKKKN